MANVTMPTAPLILQWSANLSASAMIAPGIANMGISTAPSITTRENSTGPHITVPSIVTIENINDAKGSIP